LVILNLVRKAKPGYLRSRISVEYFTDIQKDRNAWRGSQSLGMIFDLNLDLGLAGQSTTLLINTF
jgi:hypothetical protein